HHLSIVRHGRRPLYLWGGEDDVAAIASFAQYSCGARVFSLSSALGPRFSTARKARSRTPPTAMPGSAVWLRLRSLSSATAVAVMKYSFALRFPFARQVALGDHALGRVHHERLAQAFALLSTFQLLQGLFRRRHFAGDDHALGEADCRLHVSVL